MSLSKYLPEKGVRFSGPTVSLQNAAACVLPIRDNKKIVLVMIISSYDAAPDFTHLDVRVHCGYYEFVFMPPKELWEAYSNRTVCPSVRPAFLSGPYLLYSLR